MACNGWCSFPLQEGYSWDASFTSGCSQRLLGLLQEAAVLRYIHADADFVGEIAPLTSKLMQIVYFCLQGL